MGGGERVSQEPGGPHSPTEGGQRLQALARPRDIGSSPFYGYPSSAYGGGNRYDRTGGVYLGNPKSVVHRFTFCVPM